MFIANAKSHLSIKHLCERICYNVLVRGDSLLTYFYKIKVEKGIYSVKNYLHAYCMHVIKYNGSSFTQSSSIWALTEQ